MLDASGSVDYDFAMAQLLTERIIYGLNFNNDRVRVGVVTYQETEDIRFNLNTYGSRDEVIEAIAFDNDPSIKGTSTFQGIETARNEMFRSNVGGTSAPDVMIVISDGHSNRDGGSSAAIQAADDARSDGIEVFAIGIGTNVDNTEIDGVANSPSSQYAFYLPDEDDLDNVANAVLEELCQ